MARSRRKPQEKNKVTSTKKVRVPPAALPHESGVSKGAVDVTGVVPEDVYIDPDITEGHPGYEESGGSELHLSR
jgi:hypothetical protein